MATPAPVIHGWTASGYDEVRRMYEYCFTHLADRGSSFCVYVDGERVVDLWAGHSSLPRSVRATTTTSSSPNNEQPPGASDGVVEWRPDTVVNVFSCTKVMANLCLVLLVQRGACAWTDPVSKVSE